MVEYTELKEMIEHAEVGDRLKIAGATESDIGIIEEKDGFYNVLFDDGYGDETWEDTSLSELISEYFEVWEGDGKISLIKKSYDKAKDPQEVYKFIAEALKHKYGDNVRYGYPDGTLENANKIGIGAGIAVDCDNQPNGTDIWVNVGYFH